MEFIITCIIYGPFIIKNEDTFVGVDPFTVVGSDGYFIYFMGIGEFIKSEAGPGSIGFQYFKCIRYFTVSGP